MNIHQEFGGYILDANYALLDVENKSYFKQLLKNLSHFDIKHVIQNEEDDVDLSNPSPFFVIYNFRYNVINCSLFIFIIIKEII